MPSKITKTVHIYTDNCGSFMKGGHFDYAVTPHFITGCEPIIDKLESHIKKHGYIEEHDNLHSAHEFIMAAKAYIDKNISMWPWDKPSFKLQGDVEDLTNAASMLAVAIKKFNNTST